MINLRDNGAVPSDFSRATVARNTEVIVECLNKGQGLYVPSGIYYHYPIGKHLPNVTRKTTLNANMRGDGIKQSIFACIYGDPKLGAWDFDGLFCFDQAFEQISFQSNSPGPFTMRLNNGGLHYRVSFRDVAFRKNKGGDGLVIENTQHVILDGISSYRHSGWGIVLKGALGTFATVLDVEYCGAGGVYISNNGLGYRTNCAMAIGLVIHEGCAGPSIQFDGITNTRIQNCYYRSKLLFTGGAARNVIYGAEDSVCTFDNGTHSNYVYGSANTIAGDGAAFNYVGPPGGVACCQVSGPWSGAPLITLQPGVDRVPHHAKLAAGQHVFSVDYQTQGCDWLAYLNKTGADGLKYYNWATRKFDVTSVTQVSGAAVGSGTLRLPFVVDEESAVGCVIVNRSVNPLRIFAMRVSEDK